MHDMEVMFRERLVAGLRRSDVATCSRWAEQFRVMGQPFPGKWSPKWHPWTLDMHNCNGDWVGQKCAQVGFTETALNRTFFKIDVERVDCLYVLPTKTPDASDFSAARFDPALDLSDHLSNLFSDVKNIGHKRAGSVNLYIRGSRSRSQLKSVPAGFIVFDEVDEMTQENITLAEERASGQLVKQYVKISTPTIDGFGINRYYNDSTQEHWHFPCPHCGRMIELKFPDNIVITAESKVDPKINDTHLICHLCKNKLSHKDKPNYIGKGMWIPQFKQRGIRGFHINQLYAATVPPPDLAKAYFNGLQDPADEQEFHNSKLGEPHIVKGARITDKMIEDCMGQHCQGPSKHNKIITMGVDVGTWLDVEINEWTVAPSLIDNDINLSAKPRLIFEQRIEEFEHLDRLMHDYRIHYAVIDANPERRKALEFCRRFHGYVSMCIYGNNVNGKDLHEKEDDHMVTVDRTSWMDLALGRFKNQTIILPIDVSLDYRSHVKAPVRVYKKDSNGNPTAKYIEGSSADHFAHARTYAEIALPFAAAIGSPRDIRNPL